MRARDVNIADYIDTGLIYIIATLYFLSCFSMFLTRKTVSPNISTLNNLFMHEIITAKEQLDHIQKDKSDEIYTSHHERSYMRTV